MTSEARRALAVIRRCVAEDRFAVSLHFSRRLEQRGLFWPDVQVALVHPQGVQSDGLDAHGRPKWIIRGKAATDDLIEIVCAVELDETGTEFITVYWEE